MNDDFVENVTECAVRGVVRRDPGPYQKTSHEYGCQGPDDWHPAFYGCWDWHSAVHSHFLLARCLRTSNSFRSNDQLRAEAWKRLEDHLTADRIAVEVESLDKEKDGWEVPYGMAWVLRLAEEIAVLDEASDAASHVVQDMVNALAPLEAAAKSRLANWLAKMKRCAETGVAPDRKGAHSNAAFALRLMLSYACSARSSANASAIEVKKIEEILHVFEVFRADMPPLEPRGHPFLCPALVEAQLVISMNGKHMLLIDDWERVLGLQPVAGNPDDLNTCHALGLNFSRAEALADLAAHHAEQNNKGLAEKLLALACKHFEASLPYVNSGGWMADHWICTFGLLAFESIKKAKALPQLHNSSAAAPTMLRRSRSRSRSPR